MASSKVMPSSTSRNSDLKRRRSSSSLSTKPSSSSISDLQRTNINNLASSMTVDGLIRNVYGGPDQSSSSAAAAAETTLIDAEITLLDAAGAVTAISDTEPNGAAIRRHESNTSAAPAATSRTVDDVWREIVAGRRECKKEAPDEMMTLEDFLAKTGAAEEEEEEGEVKVEPVGLRPERLSGGIYSFDSVPLSSYPSQQSVDGVLGFLNGVEVVGGGRGKRRAVLEPLDKAAQQRQRRMIKNRESAARSRERKQAYQVELESLAVKLEEENEKLLREKAERTRERFKQLMEKVVPVVEKRKPRRVLRRVHSVHW